MMTPKIYLNSDEFSIPSIGFWSIIVINIASMITIVATADRYQISYDDPEDIPESKGKDVPNEASPLTGKQLIEIHNYFKAATVDEYVGIWPFKRGSVGRTYKNFGLEAKSKREFED